MIKFISILEIYILFFEIKLQLLVNSNWHKTRWLFHGFKTKTVFGSWSGRSDWVEI